MAIEPDGLSAEQKLAEAVRQACLLAALDGYEEGGLAGLCEAGRWELAVDRIRALDVASLISSQSTVVSRQIVSGREMDDE